MLRVIRMNEVTCALSGNYSPEQVPKFQILNWRALNRPNTILLALDRWAVEKS
jgi:hypothetical protein